MDYRQYLDSWTCHICGDRRPDSQISVCSTDLSAESGLDPGMVVQSVRFCNDREACLEAAKTKRFFNDWISATQLLPPIGEKVWIRCVTGTDLDGQSFYTDYIGTIEKNGWHFPESGISPVDSWKRL